MLSYLMWKQQIYCIFYNSELRRLICYDDSDFPLSCSKYYVKCYGFKYMAGFDRFEVFALVLWCLSSATSLLNTSTHTHTLLYCVLECQMIKGIPTLTTNQTNHRTVKSIHVLNILLLRSYLFWMKIEMGVVKI